MKSLESRVSDLERHPDAAEPRPAFHRCEREPCEANDGYCARCGTPCFTLDLRAADGRRLGPMGPDFGPP